MTNSTSVNSVFFIKFQLDNYYFKLSISSCYDDLVLCRLSANHIGAGDIGLVDIQRNATDGSLSVLLDLRLGLGSAVPRTEEEATVVDALLEFIVVVALVGVLLAEFAGFLEDILLYVVEEILHAPSHTIERH